MAITASFTEHEPRLGGYGAIRLEHPFAARR